MDIDRELMHSSAVQLGNLFRTRKASPVDVVRNVIALLEKWNPALNAYCTVDADGAIAQAKQSESRWKSGSPLSDVDGVIFSVKDMIHVKGYPTRFGSRAMEEPPPSTFDAPSVASLRASGCIFLGKTTTSELGWKGTADSPLNGIVPNVWDRSKTSGGSSGGAASAAMTGLGTFHLGTDGGGSLRIPASFSGAYGMKASFGRVPAWPAGPMLTLSNVGPIARNICDLERLLQIITQPDLRDWNALPPLDWKGGAEGSLRGLRIGIHAGEDICDGPVNDRMRAVTNLLADAGCDVIRIELPLEKCRNLLKIHWEAAARHLVEGIPEERRCWLDEGLKRTAARGESISLPEYYGAMIERQRFGESMQAITASYDLIMTPTTPILPFNAGREVPDSFTAGSDWFDWNPFTYPFNLSRQPAISIPAGIDPLSGMPIGVQLASKLFDDVRLIHLARLMSDLFLEVELIKKRDIPMI